MQYAYARLCVVFAVLAWMAAAVHAQGVSEPSVEVQREYRTIVGRAITEFDLGHAAEARALFVRAHALWPSARTKRTLGMTAFELRMYAQALEELQGALDDSRRPLPEDQRAQVAALLDETKSCVGRYQLQVSPVTAEVFVDGVAWAAERSLVLGLGVHQLVARAPGYRELRRDLVVQGREDAPLVLHLESLPAEVSAPAVPQPEAATMAVKPVTIAPSQPHTIDVSYNRTPATIAFGIAAAGVVVGTVSGIIAFTKKHDVDDLAAGYLAADISTASFIIAGAGAVTGTLLWIYAPQSNAEPSAVQPTVGLATLGVRGRF